MEPLTRQLRRDDVADIVAMVEATAVFRPAEVEIARELVLEALGKGEEDSGYHFLLLEVDGVLAGYACWGPTPGTEGTWDLYWLVVAPACQGRGLASRLLVGVEEAVRGQGGRLLVAETSDTGDYAQAQGFYRARGFALAAHIPHFYKPDDGKLILVRTLPGRGGVRTGT